MALHIQIDTPGRLHYARTSAGGFCAFTATCTGYRALLKWCRDVGRGQALVFDVPSGGYGGLLVRWLQEQGGFPVCLN